MSIVVARLSIDSLLFCFSDDENALASVVLALSLSSILPGAHPDATPLTFPSADFLPESLTRVHASDVDLQVLVALKFVTELYRILTGQTLHGDIHPKGLYTLNDRRGEVKFVVIRLESLVCPHGTVHKSASRQFQFSQEEVKLNCFSRRCQMAGNQLIARIGWMDLSALWATDLPPSPASSSVAADNSLFTPFNFFRSLIAQQFAQ